MDTYDTAANDEHPLLKGLIRFGLLLLAQGIAALPCQPRATDLKTVSMGIFQIRAAAQMSAAPATRPPPRMAGKVRLVMAIPPRR